MLTGMFQKKRELYEVLTRLFLGALRMAVELGRGESLE